MQANEASEPTLMVCFCISWDLKCGCRCKESAKQEEKIKMSNFTTLQIQEPIIKEKEEIGTHFARRAVFLQ